MNKKEKEQVRFAVENEGFDYTFRHWSNFHYIDDQKFHELRDAYIQATERLADYVGCVEF